MATTAEGTMPRSSGQIPPERLLISMYKTIGSLQEQNASRNCFRYWWWRPTDRLQFCRTLRHLSRLPAASDQSWSGQRGRGSL